MNGYTLNGHCLHNLYTRQLCPDPYYYLSVFEQSYYGLRSFVQRLKLDKRLKEHDGCVNCINFSTGGGVLASGSDDLHVVLWNWEKGNLLAKVESGHMANVFQVSIPMSCLLLWNVGLFFNPGFPLQILSCSFGSLLTVLHSSLYPLLTLHSSLSTPHSPLLTLLHSSLYSTPHSPLFFFFFFFFLFKHV